ncbi:MAG: DUF935 domain-containing protein [Burkholderiales bacterium]|nr:DUF935 domain-containing protein [Burkholderiales bacterium]
MAILDQFGRPIDTGILREPQSARVASLHQMFAGHPSRGLTPQKLARILDDAEGGSIIDQADLGEDMEEKDAHILAELSKRKRALLTLDWDVIAPEGADASAGRLADHAKEMLAAIPDIEDVMLDALDAIGKGFACLEIDWHRPGREWVPRQIHWRPQNWFQLDILTRREIRLRDNSGDGAPLTPFGWVFHVHKAKSGYVGRGGLHRVLCWPYLFKNYAVRDLAEFLEIYGLPMRLGTYPPGASDREKATLLQAVTSIGHGAAGIVPEGMRIEFQEAAKGTHDPFQAMMDWCERSQSKAILGQTLSAEAKATGLGSGLANVHNEVRRDILEGDARQLAATLTRDLVYPLLVLNSAQADLARLVRLEFDTREPEDLALYADALPKLVDAGLKIPANWARERLQIPEPQDGEEVLERRAAQNTVAPETGVDRGGGMPDPAGNGPRSPEPGTPLRYRALSARAARAALAAIARDDGPDLVDELAAAALEDWQPTMEPMVERIRQALRDSAAAGEGVEQFQQRLAQALPELDVAQFAELLARAAFLSRLLGEADVELDR